MAPACERLRLRPLIDTVELARRIRIHALKMTSRGGSSHVGSVLSCADILGVLYGSVMSVDPRAPSAPGRDRFLLSKGHAGAGVYAALAERGFFSTDKLSTHFMNGSDLSGHVSHKNVPGVELSTGSLGHALAVGAGMAYGGMLDDRSFRVFVLLSDGECDEGSTWESILFASHHKLGNLVAIVDYNKMQSLTSVEETLNLEPFAEKWRSFGWHVVEVDGHDHVGLVRVLGTAHGGRSAPTCVIAHTTKGKGVSFMEGKVLWHYRNANDEELRAALQELEASR